ncbi:MAG: DUF975 family protein [Kiritimatiellae bacterium]|nr:DUF975 family protein [Kiritimatiellia bacterium]
MKTFSELKTSAKAQINGKIGLILVMNLIFIGVSVLTCLLPILGNIANLIICSAFTLGFALVYLKIAKGEEISIGNVFYGFDDFWTAIKAQFFTSLFCSLWYLLFIIPGIIKACSYSLTFYILAENKGMPVLEAITLSRKMMDGHKMDLFLLGLSFIGWFTLVAITFGIAGIWVYPYFWATFANFYLSVKEDYISKKVTQAA